MLEKAVSDGAKRVALHPEGVDRNWVSASSVRLPSMVALHPEGVDRNIEEIANDPETPWSPSTRRAWIEIALLALVEALVSVALHPEGVDRNILLYKLRQIGVGRPPPGGRG